MNEPRDNEAGRIAELAQANHVSPLIATLALQVRTQAFHNNENLKSTLIQAGALAYDDAVTVPAGHRLPIVEQAIKDAALQRMGVRLTDHNPDLIQLTDAAVQAGIRSNNHYR